MGSLVKCKFITTMLDLYTCIIFKWMACYRGKSSSQENVLLLSKCSRGAPPASTVKFQSLNETVARGDSDVSSLLSPCSPCPHPHPHPLTANAAGRSPCPVLASFPFSRSESHLSIGILRETSLGLVGRHCPCPRALSTHHFHLLQGAGPEPELTV